MIDSLVNSLALSVGCNPVESNYANLVIPRLGSWRLFFSLLLGSWGGGGGGGGAGGNNFAGFNLMNQN